MEKEILEIIDKKVELSLTDNYHFAYVDGTENAANEIASMVMEFVEWKDSNTFKSESIDGYHIYHILGSYTIEELFQYWNEHVRRK